MTVKAVRFEADKHLMSVQCWCIDRSMSVFPEGWLPPTGYIVEGVLAAWLYKTDSGLAYMENIISNPTTIPEQRSIALDLVTALCIEEARACGFKFLLGFSCIPTVVEKAARFGFRASKDPYFTLVKELS